MIQAATSQVSTSSVQPCTETASNDACAPQQLDRFEVQPYFADGVFAKARAARDRATAANQARIDNPIAVAKAIHTVYEGHPLVSIIKDTFVQMGAERRHPVVYWFDDLPLVLTERGFRDLEGQPIGDKLALPGKMGAVAACQKIDMALANLAEAPEKFVSPEPRRVFGPVKAPPKSRYVDDSSSSVEVAMEKIARPSTWYEKSAEPGSEAERTALSRRTHRSFLSKIFHRKRR